MRVLYFTRDYTPHDHRFLSALAATPHEIYALRLERRGMQREDRPLPPQVTQIPWRGGQKPARWRDYPALLHDLNRVLREVQPDVIHAGPVPTVALLAAFSRRRCPLVSMSWGSDLLMDAARSRWDRWCARAALQRSGAMLADCQAVADAAAALGFPRERMVLFPWGVDLTHFHPGAADDLRERRGWQDAFVLLSVRSWEPIYGVDVLARAFVLAAREAPELRLALLGGGSQAGLLRKIFENAGVSDRVFFGGRVGNEDLPEMYRAADLYVSTSHSDGSSVSLLEAMACGKPALVSDIPGNREWVTPGENGWWFPDGDVAALAQRMVEAAHVSAEKRVRMGANARSIAEARADWSQNQKKIVQAYELAMKKK